MKPLIRGRIIVLRSYHKRLSCEHHPERTLHPSDECNRMTTVGTNLDVGTVLRTVRGMTGVRFDAGHLITPCALIVCHVWHLPLCGEVG